MSRTGAKAAIAVARKRFHAALLGSILTFDRDGVPGNADRHNRSSVAIAKAMAMRLGGGGEAVRKVAQTSGMAFEDICASFLKETFPKATHLRPGNWQIGTPAEVLGRARSEKIAAFEQYRHLKALADIADAKPELAATLGGDYLIEPDVVLARMPEADERINQAGLLVDNQVAQHSPLRRRNNEFPLLHAVISCKWTIRSDRVQNARSEGLNLVRNRKGRLPHIAVITGEPTPARLASIALGTGEVDCVYHFALPELAAAIADVKADDAMQLLKIMIDGNRLRDISDLPLDLAI
jgi:hypothetical protein